MKGKGMKKIKPMVSVIMPTHNGARTIESSIRSVLNQEYKDFEFIIIVDASTDNTLDIIEQNNDERIRVHRLSKNSHICFALNEGINHARGKYIARIDDDDIWEKDKLSKQIAFMENNPDYGACFSWVSIIDKKGDDVEESPVQDVFKQPNRMRRDWVRYMFNELSCLCHPTAVIAKKVLEEVGNYNIALVQLQDFELWLRIAKRYPIYVIQEQLVKYRWDPLNSNSISTRSETIDYRSGVEFTYVLSHCLDDIDDKEFSKIFSLDFTNKKAATAEEIAVERALSMFKATKSCRNKYTRDKGFALLVDILNNPKALSVLKQEYGLTQMEVYELSAGKSVDEVLSANEE